jgi:hypothetical protein
MSRKRSSVSLSLHDPLLVSKLILHEQGSLAGVPVTQELPLPSGKDEVVSGELLSSIHQRQKPHSGRMSRELLRYRAEIPSLRPRCLDFR